MANRRMFSKRLVTSARFLKMPLTSQLLYFHLGMQADDEGIVEAYPVMRLVGCGEDDLRVLVAKNFVQVLNEDLVAYITDWNENNTIRADRKISSIYKDLLLQIVPNDQVTTKCQPNDNQVTTNCQPNDRISKDKISKDKISKDSISKISKKIISALLSESSLSEPVCEKVLEFLDYREEIKKPYKSERSIKSLITQIEKQEQAIGSIAVIRVIDTTIQNQWQGLFWDKVQKPEVSKSVQHHLDIESWGKQFE